MNQLLRQKGLETYCPLNKIPKKWSDRVKVVEEPLFKSYVFVRIDTMEQTAVRSTNGVVNFVYWCGKPAIVQPAEIELIKQFLVEHKHVAMQDIPLKRGSKVIVQQGLFAQEEALVVNIYGKKVELQLPTLGCMLVATLDRNHVSPV